MLKRTKIRCDNCRKKVNSDHKFCPSCGVDLMYLDRDEKMSKALFSQLGFQEKEVRSNFRSIQLICKIAGAFLLLMDFVLLVWFCWTGYIGNLVKFDKPLPKYVFSIDSEFFNLAGPNSYFHIFLLIAVLFGLLKVGFWLLSIKSPAPLKKWFYSKPKS